MFSFLLRRAKLKQARLRKTKPPRWLTNRLITNCLSTRTRSRLPNGDTLWPRSATTAAINQTDVCIILFALFAVLAATRLPAGIFPSVCQSISDIFVTKRCPTPSSHGGRIRNGWFWWRVFRFSSSFIYDDWKDSYRAVQVADDAIDFLSTRSFMGRER